MNTLLLLSVLCLIPLSLVHSQNSPQQRRSDVVATTFVGGQRSQHYLSYSGRNSNSAATAGGGNSGRKSNTKARLRPRKRTAKTYNSYNVPSFGPHGPSVGWHLPHGPSINGPFFPGTAYKSGRYYSSSGSTVGVSGRPRPYSRQRVRSGSSSSNNRRISRKRTPRKESVTITSRIEVWEPAISSSAKVVDVKNSNIPVTTTTTLKNDKVQSSFPDVSGVKTEEDVTITTTLKNEKVQSSFPDVSGMKTEEDLTITSTDNVPHKEIISSVENTEEESSEIPAYEMQYVYVDDDEEEEDVKEEVKVEESKIEKEGGWEYQKEEEDEGEKEGMWVYDDDDDEDAGVRRRRSVNDEGKGMNGRWIVGGEAGGGKGKSTTGGEMELHNGGEVNTKPFVTQKGIERYNATLQKERFSPGIEHDSEDDDEEKDTVGKWGNFDEGTFLYNHDDTKERRIWLSSVKDEDNWKIKHNPGKEDVVEINDIWGYNDDSDFDYDDDDDYVFEGGDWQSSVKEAGRVKGGSWMEDHDGGGRWIEKGESKLLNEGNFNAEPLVTQKTGVERYSPIPGEKILSPVVPENIIERHQIKKLPEGSMLTPFKSLNDISQQSTDQKKLFDDRNNNL